MFLGINSVFSIVGGCNFWLFFKTEFYFFFLEQLLNIFGGFWQVTTAGVALNFGIFLVFSGLIFSIGIFGVVFNRKNVLLLMASVEIMFLGINLVFISGYIFLNLEISLVYALINLSVAAAEAAIGFGLLMASFKNRRDITFKSFNRLKG
jgi:NADH-quinone oxidoreductase subunit K